MKASVLFGAGALFWGFQVLAGDCSVQNIQLNVTTLGDLQKRCGDPEREANEQSAREFFYSTFSVMTGADTDTVIQLSTWDTGFIDENQVSPGMSLPEFRARFPGFEYSRRNAADPVSGNLYHFQADRVSIVTVR